MIVFKKLKTKRINPFKGDDESEAPANDVELLEEIERSDWKQKSENKKRTSDGKIFQSGIGDNIDDTTPIRKNRRRYGRFKKNTCRNSLSENKISPDEKEFDKLSIPVKRKVSSDSDHSMDDSDYSPVPTKIGRFSKDEDSEIESDRIEDSTNVFQDEDSSDVRSSSIEGGYSQDVKKINKNNLNSVEKKSSDGDRHMISQIPPTEKKKWPQKPCTICRRYGVRHDTRYYCKFCNAALCKEPCFREYHSM